MALTPPWLPGMDPASEVTAAADSTGVSDSLLGQDSLRVADSLQGERMSGFVLENPVVTGEVPEQRDSGLSWVYLAGSLLFFVVAVRIHNSSRYFRALMNDMTDTRERQNVFDDTVKETSFLIILNVFWSCCMGVMLWQLVKWSTGPGYPWSSLTILDRTGLGIAICSGVCLAYNAVMLTVYWIVGNVFTDSRRTGQWVRGAASSNGIGSAILFPMGLLSLTMPQWTPVLLIIAAVTFILGKLIFIFKGFRIFFNQFSSWILFLYYLCSLEIVPLLLTYVLTLELCSRWL